MGLDTGRLPGRRPFVVLDHMIKRFNPGFGATGCPAGQLSQDRSGERSGTGEEARYLGRANPPVVSCVRAPPVSLWAHDLGREWRARLGHTEQEC